MAYPVAGRLCGMSKNPGNLRKHLSDGERKVRAHEDAIHRLAGVCDGFVSIEELALRAADSDDPYRRIAGLRILGASVL